MEFLIEMGYTETEISNALEYTGGNVDEAIDFILSQQQLQANNNNTDQQKCPIINKIGALSDFKLTALELSQYSFGDAATSACTAISCNSLSSILERLESQQSIHDVEFLTELLIEGVHKHRCTSISNAHSSVDEYFLNSENKQQQDALRSLGHFQGSLTSRNCFEEMIEQIYTFPAHPEKYIAVVLTKPPETISIFLSPQQQTSKECCLFDSHPRPQLNIDGAYIATTSIDDRSKLVDFLHDLFPFVPASNQQEGGRGSSMSFMEEMYNTYEVHAFQRPN